VRECERDSWESSAYGTQGITFSSSDIWTSWFRDISDLAGGENAAVVLLTGNMSGALAVTKEVVALVRSLAL
jgi:hypothetical protein